ncbi:hypothetical protein [Dietzia sp. PP-33]|jgi:hypothetical protein|uniref:hypothetical protein n=1 Tax=Dietzia sp. PP-33 TaxID=2957500 RepID=UPI0029A61E28|nr:hypothetical protein [Dietzia sp. PP-33]MDX2356775.1 hypothetical protein [Dietzia sp. PP-33]
MSARPDDDQTDRSDHTETPPTGSHEMTSNDLHADTATRPDQPLHDPLPYGAGFTDPHRSGYGTPTGYGVGFEPEPAPASTDAVARRERSGSPVLAVAGLLSLGVAVWAVLGAPVITSTVVIAAGLVLAIIVGLVMVVRR